MKGNRSLWNIIATTIITTLICNLAIHYFNHNADHDMLSHPQHKPETIPEDKEPLKETKCYLDPVPDQFRAVSLSSNETYHSIKEVCSTYTEQDFQSCTVPNVVHLIPGRGFKFHHYLNIKAIKKILKPERIYIHGELLPFDNKFFMQSVAEFDLDLVVSRNIETIFDGVPVRNGEHRADILRIEALLKYGGIYLDMDAYPIKPFEQFLKDEFSIGYQNQEENYGLNNGIMIAKKCSRFLLKWYEQYKSFNPENWDEHSVQLPMKLYEQDSSHVKAYKHKLLSWWCFDGNPKTLPMFKKYKQSEWRDVYAIHSFYRVYEGTTPFPIDFDTVKTLDNSFGRFARHVLYDGPPM
ncbi:hypothetical protein HDV01_007904 [Terramyces sp. JEL0728]|nr:hypothetical protein HDV01_007904 [Terramyces sp. JEL0728]